MWGLHPAGKKEGVIIGLRTGNDSSKYAHFSVKIHSLNIRAGAKYG
jgi:hypothetical protein